MKTGRRIAYMGALAGLMIFNLVMAFRSAHHDGWIEGSCYVAFRACQAFGHYCDLEENCTPRGHWNARERGR